MLDLGDVERVHDMRVATRACARRWRSSRPAFPRKRHRKALKRVKELADALGERRDATSRSTAGGSRGRTQAAGPTAAGDERCGLIEDVRDEQRRGERASSRRYVEPRSD